MKKANAYKDCVNLSETVLEVQDFCRHSEGAEHFKLLPYTVMETEGYHNISVRKTYLYVFAKTSYILRGRFIKIRVCEHMSFPFCLV